MKITRRSRSRRAGRSRKACRKAYRKAYRKACRSTRRRMGGAHMTVHQPYTSDNIGEFDIEIKPNMEDMYAQILNHRYNAYSDKMARTFADQPNGDGKYIVVFDDTSATIKLRNQDSDMDARLAALYDE